MIYSKEKGNQLSVSFKNLMEDAENEQFTRKESLDSVANLMINEAKNPLETTIGNFYRNKAEFYEKPNLENAKKFDVYRPIFENNELFGLLYQIDRIQLLTAYINKDYTAAEQIIQNIRPYIKKEEFFVERTALVHATNQNPDLLYTESHKRTLEEALALIQNKNSSLYSALIVALSSYFDHIGHQEEAIDILEEYIENMDPKRNNLHRAFAYQILARRRDNKNDAVEDIQKGIQNLKTSNYNMLLNHLYSDLGGYYTKLEKFNSAYDAYEEASKIDLYIEDTFSYATHQIRIAKSLYLKDQTISAELEDHLKKARKFSKNHPQILREYFETQLFIFQNENLNQQVVKYQDSLIDLNDRYQQLIQSDANDFILKKMLEFQAKDDQVYVLENENKKKQKQLRKGVLLVGFSLVGLLFFGYLSWELIKRLRRTQQIQAQLATQNNELEVEKLKLQEANFGIHNKIESLIEKERQLQAKLQSKLSLLYTQSNTLSNVRKSIQEDSKFNAQQKAHLNRLLDDFNLNLELVDEYKMEIINSNQDFVERLLQRHPKLSNNNVLLCIYLRMQLSSKEIAVLLGNSPESIKVARGRLKKKLGYKSNEKSLTNYLANI